MLNKLLRARTKPRCLYLASCSCSFRENFAHFRSCTSSQQANLYLNLGLSHFGVLPYCGDALTWRNTCSFVSSIMRYRRALVAQLVVSAIVVGAAHAGRCRRPHVKLHSCSESSRDSHTYILVPQTCSSGTVSICCTRRMTSESTACQDRGIPRLQQHGEKTRVNIVFIVKQSVGFGTVICILFPGANHSQPYSINIRAHHVRACDCTLALLTHPHTQTHRHSWKRPKPFDTLVTEYV